MKQRIFIYLFIFSILLILFQYVNSKRIFEEQHKKMESYQHTIKSYKDSIVVLQHDNLELSHFNLDRNEDAISYFEDKGFNVSDLIPKIKDELYKSNEFKGQHPIIPYASSEGRRLMINTVKLLNHKWIIADFSDGEYWGEVFLAYYIEDDNTLTFRLVESFLYPMN